MDNGGKLNSGDTGRRSFVTITVPSKTSSIISLVSRSTLHKSFRRYLDLFAETLVCVRKAGWFKQLLKRPELENLSFFIPIAPDILIKVA